MSDAPPAAPRLWPPRPLTPVGIICLVLSLWGCLAIYNATFHLTPPYLFVGRQLLWVGTGAAALLVATNLSARLYRRALPAAAAVLYLALWLVLRFGIRINGMRGWYAWHGIFVQPAELAKPVFVLSVAWLLVRTRDQRGNVRSGFLPLLALYGLWVLPILLQPDFGMLLIYTVTFVTMCWCFGVRSLHLAGAGLAGLPLALWAVHTKPYLLNRLTGFLQPEQHAQTAGWHILQFQRTLASGGLFGRSWGKGVWSQAYLPLGYSDSIFATMAEAVGFIGVLPVVLLVLAWVCYGHWRLRRVRDSFAAAAILGIVTMLGAQAFIHLAVNLDLLPPTGITLPLISYGGSSLVSTLACVGIIESLGRQPAQADVPAMQPACNDESVGSCAAGHFAIE